MKQIKRVLPIMMSITLLMTSSLPAYAEETPSEKEEVIYINLKTDGQVKDIYAVNIFGEGEVTDYGDYSSVKMLNTTDPISQTGDRISFSSSTERIYYEGKMNQTTIPWDISLRYFMDGKEYSAQDIAGKSGELEIRMSVKENKACKGTFFDDYALQASFTFDTEKVADIRTENATVANVGSDKQYTYTIMPGKEKDITITAEVTDFEMDAVAINGVRLNLDVEVDEDELLDKIKELQDAIEEMDDGSLEMKDGVMELKDSVEDDLQSGVDDLVDGADELRDGAVDLKNGTVDLQDGAKDMKTGTEELYDGAVSLDDGISEIESGLKKLSDKSSELTEGSAKVKAALLEIQTKLQQGTVSTEDLTELVNASAQVKQGISDAYAGVCQIEQKATIAAYEQAMTAQLIEAGVLPEGATFTLAGLKQQNLDTISALEGQIAASGSQTQTCTVTRTVTTTGESGSTEEDENAEENVIEDNEDKPESITEGGEDKSISENSVNETEEMEEENEDTEENITEGKDRKVSRTTVTTVTTYENPVDNAITSEQLQAVVNLLKLNNANIDGISQYLMGINEGLLVLEKGEDGKGGLKALNQSYAQFDQEIQNLALGLGDMASGMSELQKGIDMLVTEYDKLDKGINEYTKGVSSAKSGSGELKDGSSKLLEGADELKEGGNSLYDGVGELLDGVMEFYDATGTLKDGTGELDEGVQELLSAIITLYDGTEEMKDGTGELRDETKDMDQEIQDEIDELLETITGDDGEVVSYVSDQNTNVTSVQFVIQTEAIEMEEAEPVEEETEENLTFWQKFLRLFGWY